jgi:hypothetical protein
MLRRSLTALAAAVLAISAPIATATQPFITIEGQVDCGQWIKGETEGLALALEHYLIGLLNGMVMGARIEFWHAGGVAVSREQVFLWMDNYCRREPFSDPVAGATVLMKERTGDAWTSFHAVQR